MTTPVITFLYNNSQNDVVNTGGAEGDSNWKIFNSVNDRLSFLGNETDDQDSNSSKSVFSIPESDSQEAPRQFVNNYAESKYSRIWLAGSNANQGGGGNYRYPLGFYIDGTTAQSPTLQVWDSTSHSSYNLEVLGSGLPGNSMIRAISTTNGLPGNEWAGTPLAGDGGSNSITLTTGAVASPQMVYFNLRLLVPSTATPFAEEPVLCLYLTYS